MSEARIQATAREASRDLVAVERLLRDRGFHVTAHAVNEASRKLGWEAHARPLTLACEMSELLARGGNPNAERIFQLTDAVKSLYLETLS